MPENKNYNSEDLQRWRDNVSRGSTQTSEIYYRRLKAFCQKNSLTPTSIIKLDTKGIKNLLMDNVTVLEKEGYKGSYIKSIMKAVKSWLTYNDKKTPRIKIKNADARETVENEIIPTQNELKTVFNQLRQRGKVSLTLMSQSGLRPQVLGMASDGLKIGDIVDLELTGNKILFKKTPALIKVRTNLSKISHQYLTFLSSEGCEYLKAYLQERLAKNEELNKESAVIGVDHNTAYHNYPFMTTQTIMKELRQGIRNAGFQWRPYVFRHYFATKLSQTEFENKITHSWSQYFMGHKGDMMAKYTTNKNMLPQEMVEQMRESYRKCENKLSSTVKTSDEKNEQENIALNMATRLLSSLFPDFKFDVKIKEHEKKLNRSLNVEEKLKFITDLTEAERKKKSQFKVVDEEELEEILNTGEYEPDRQVNTHKFLVKRRY